MEQTLKIPEFKNEGDEARWWVENQDHLAHLFERAAAEGKLCLLYTSGPPGARRQSGSAGRDLFPELSR